MKALLVILSVVTLAVITSCTNSNAKETNSTNAVLSKEGTDNIISYKVNGELVTTSGWNISRFKLTNVSSESLNITTNMHDEKRTINMNISGTEPGEYTAKVDDRSDHNFYGSYFPDYIDDLSNTYSFQSGSFTISKIDTVRNIVNGSFWGTVKNIKGEILEISDGKIVNGRLTAGVTNYE
jgi:hypothetical protein